VAFRTERFGLVLNRLGLGGVSNPRAPIAAEVSALWEQQVTVVNHPGGGSTAAPTVVARAPADGYTLWSIPAPRLQRGAGKRSPVCPAGGLSCDRSSDQQPYVLVTPKTAGIATLSELISAAKKGQIN